MWLVINQSLFMTKKTIASSLSNLTKFENNDMISFTEVGIEKTADFLNRVILIKEDSFGSNQAQYSSVLLKSFIRETAMAKVLPKAILLMNRGVLLAISTSIVLEELRLLESKGVLILSNCSCLESHKALDELSVGGIATMGNIVEIINLAKSVVII